jgi:hypothetical protein
MLRNGGNAFYDQKNKIPMKFLEFKRFGIRIIAEFCRIPSGFPNQAVNNVLRTLVHTNPPLDMTHERDIIDDALATAMHAMQTTYTTTLGGTPGALVFA